MNNDQPTNSYFTQPNTGLHYLDMDMAILYHHCRAGVMPGTYRMDLSFPIGLEPIRVQAVGSRHFSKDDIIGVLLNPGLIRIEHRYNNGMPSDVCSFSQVMTEIARERVHQDDKWGRDKKQSVIGYIAIMEKELAEAKLGWLMGDRAEGRDSALAELVQVAAVAVRCLQHYGTEGIPITGNDLPRDIL